MPYHETLDYPREHCTYSMASGSRADIGSRKTSAVPGVRSYSDQHGNSERRNRHNPEIAKQRLLAPVQDSSLAFGLENPCGELATRQSVDRVACKNLVQPQEPERRDSVGR